MNSSTTLGVIRSGPEEEEGGERKRKELPDDLVVEILARLPVKSLLRFRSVSKHWYSLIVSPNFITLHFTQSLRKKRAVPLLFYSFEWGNVNPPNTTVSFGFGDVTERLIFWDDITNVNIVGCSNGLVCLFLSEGTQKKYVLWNPATRQVREIGNPPMEEGLASTDIASPLPQKSNSGFCIDPVTNAIKVVHIRLGATDERENRVQVNVFSTATKSWTEKENITVPFPIGLSGCRTFILQTICVDGYMLWRIVITTISCEFKDTYILSYDMNGEVFKRIELPFLAAHVECDLAAYDRSLAVFVRERTGSTVDVWVLNDCSGANQSWSKLLTFRPSLKAALIVGFFRKDDVDLILYWKKPRLSLQLYDPANGETKEFGKKASGRNTFLYSEGLTSLY